MPKPATAHEADFFDGIDTSLVGLAARLGAEESKVPFLRPALESLQKHVDEASKAYFRYKILPLARRLCLQGETKQKSWSIRWKIRSFLRLQRTSC